MKDMSHPRMSLQPLSASGTGNMILSQILSLGIFLANPVRVTERGSGTIHGIVKAYISILETAKSIPHKDNQRESSFTFSKQVKG